MKQLKENEESEKNSESLSGDGESNWNSAAGYSQQTVEEDDRGLDKADLEKELREGFGL